jgi:PHP family Zn ribbon phosphoesterase
VNQSSIAAKRVRELAASLAGRSRQPGLDGAPIREVATRTVAIQDAVRTPSMREALQLLLKNHEGEAVVLCAGIPEDLAILPAAVPAAVTVGRNVASACGRMGA